MKGSKLITVAVLALAMAFAGCRNRFTVTFDSNGGSEVACRAVANGDTLSEPVAPVKEDYTFAGWFVDYDTFMHQATFPDTVTCDVTFHAKWLAGIWTRVGTAARLDAIRDSLAGNYFLTADISLSDYSTGEGWTPVGANKMSFTGKLDGNGHKITDLTINRPEKTPVGLFSDIYGGSISNLGVEIGPGGISGGISAGGIAGYVAGNSAITNCYSAGNITSYDMSGGVVGNLYNSTITGCYSTGNIGSSGEAGGIAGSASDCAITNCYTTGDITSVASSGGIVGAVWGGGTITCCYSAGNVISTATSKYSRSGGIAGFVFNGTIANCVAINPVIHEKNRAGRIVGEINTFNGIGTISNNNFALNTMTATGAGKFNASDPKSYGISKTIEQLQIQSTYSDVINGDGLGGLGWQFGNNDAMPWKMPAGGGQPILYWQ